MKVVFFGDSITVGQYISPPDTWAVRLCKYLDSTAKEEGMDITTQIEAVNGRTSRQALEDIAVEVQKHGPELVMIQFGMNDCNHWDTDRGLPRVSKAGFEANMREMIDRALHFGAQRVLLNTNHPSGRNNPFAVKPELSYEQSNRQYNAITREVAGLYDQTLVSLSDMEAVFDADIVQSGNKAEDYLMPAPDLLHLNQKGHDLYYTHLLPVIEQNVREING